MRRARLSLVTRDNVGSSLVRPPPLRISIRMHVFILVCMFPVLTTEGVVVFAEHSSISSGGRDLRQDPAVIAEHGGSSGTFSSFSSEKMADYNHSGSLGGSQEISVSHSSMLPADDITKDIEKTERDLKKRKKKIQQLKEKLLDGLDFHAESSSASTSGLIPGNTSGAKVPSVAHDHDQTTAAVANEMGGYSGSAESARQPVTGTISKVLSISTRDNNVSTFDPSSIPVSLDLPTVSATSVNVEDDKKFSGTSTVAHPHILDDDDLDWTNKTLAQLAELSKIQNSRSNADHSKPGQSSPPENPFTQPGGILARITSWFHAESEYNNSSLSTLDMRSQDEIIEELKASILEHAKREKKAEQSIKARKDALKLAVHELQELETEINATEYTLLKAQADMNKQRERMDVLENDKKMRDATEELENAAAALKDGKLLHIDYETGRVTDLRIDSLVDTLENNGRDIVNHDNNDNDKDRQGQIFGETTTKDQSILGLLEERLGFKSANQKPYSDLAEVESVMNMAGGSGSDSFHQEVAPGFTKFAAKKNGTSEGENTGNLEGKTTTEAKVSTENSRSGFLLSSSTTLPALSSEAAVPDSELSTPHRSHALVHDIPTIVSSVNVKDKLQAAEEKLAAVTVEKSPYQDHYVTDKNIKQIKGGVSDFSASKRKMTRIKKAIELAKRARHDSDPALIESETGLIIDMAKLMAAAAIGGLVSRSMRMPIILGFIAGGIACGPSGLHLVNGIRRMQTLASLGSVFMMFALGVDFPVEEVLRLRRLVVTSTFAGQLIIVVLVGYLLKESGFAGSLRSACMVSVGLSVSSTSIALDHLGGNEIGNSRRDSAGVKHGEGPSLSTELYSNIIFGMIACNELTSAFILSVPELVVPDTASTEHLGAVGGHFDSTLRLIFIVVYLLVLLLGTGRFSFAWRFVDICMSHLMRCLSCNKSNSLSRFETPNTSVDRFSSSMLYSSSSAGLPMFVTSGFGSGSRSKKKRGLVRNELQLVMLTIVSFCLVCAVLASVLGLSLELGAFFAGLLVRRTTRLDDGSGGKAASYRHVRQSLAKNAELAFAECDHGDLDLGTPSKPEALINKVQDVPDAKRGHVFAQVNLGTIIGIVMPLRIFFSFLYYATAGMALNLLFMFNNFHVIFGLALFVSTMKAVIFGFALLASGAPKQPSFTSGIAMSSIGEISLLYINKAHLLNESLVTRRMMLIYMASTIFSMILTPMILRFFVGRNQQHHVINSEKVDGGNSHQQVVMEMTATNVSHVDKEGIHTGKSRRRKKEHLNTEDNVFPVMV